MYAHTNGIQLTFSIIVVYDIEIPMAASRHSLQESFCEVIETYASYLYEYCNIIEHKFKVIHLRELTCIPALAKKSSE